MLLPDSQRDILRVLADGRLHAYRDIVLGTGKYSNLPAELRQRHPRSLGSKGMVSEFTISTDTDRIAAFQITVAGLVAIHGCKAKEAARMLPAMDDALRDFRARWNSWRVLYREETRQAKILGLRHNPYLLLRALADGREQTFADLARATGIFSGLPQDLRARHARHRSLASLGLIRETILDGDDNDFQHAFQITPEGQKLLARLCSSVENATPPPTR